MRRGRSTFGRVLKGSVPERANAAYGGEVRWDRVFDELGSQAHDALAEERDALADDLVAENWRASSWLDFLTGTVEFDVLGAGRLRGQISAVAELIEIRNADRRFWLEPACVLSAEIENHRRSRVSPMQWRIQLGEAFSSRVRVVTRSGSVHEGILVNLGGDFFELSVGLNRQAVLIPRNALSVLSMSLTGG